MNPQKLAGQCGKLKCCLNFETDAYAEASAQLPPKDTVLLTQDGEYHQFKVDILARQITYSTDKHLAVNLVTIPAARAFEIIALNKQGVKVEQLSVIADKEEPQKEYVELVGQDSLTRFDKSKSKRRNKQHKHAETPKENHQEQPAQNKKQSQPHHNSGQPSGHNNGQSGHNNGRRHQRRRPKNSNQPPR